MANNTSLYTTVASPNVASNNFTTLYNGITSVGVDTNYGNANVEAFLNSGTDGGNQVQNIVMSGNINVGGNSNLGNVGNVHITGGSLNYILQTDGSGGLNWEPFPNLATDTTLYIHFDVTNIGNNQTFTYANLVKYANSNVMAVMKNGVNIEPSQYSISGNVLTINVLLDIGDTIDVLPGAVGSNLQPGGNLTEVQYNGGAGTLSGNASFTFDQGNSTVSVGNISTGNVFLNGNSVIYSDSTTLQLISNGIYSSTGIYIDNEDVAVYANNNVVIETNESGLHRDWTFQPDGNIKFPDGTYQNTAFVGGGGGTVAGSNTQVQYNNAGNFGAKANFTFNSSTNTLTVPNIVGNVSNANYANFAGSALTADSATTAGNSNYSNTANVANTANYANFAGTAFAVSGANVSGIVANANFATYSNYAAYAGNIETSNNANYANYANFAGHVIDAAQSNITSVGTLISLTVAGNISIGNIDSTGSSNIADTKFTKFNEHVINDGSVSGTITPNAGAGTIYEYILTGNITFNNLLNAVAGTSMTIKLTQDSTGGRTLTSSMLFAGGNKTLSIDPNAVDIISLYYNGATYYAVLSKGYV